MVNPFLREFVCNKNVSFHTSILLKVNFFSFNFQAFFQMFRIYYFKECFLMAANAIYFFKLFPLSRKQVRTPVGSLRKFENLLPRTFKLFDRPYHDHLHITYDQE